MDCGGSTGHNFSFTSELHFAFTFRAGASQTVTFTGDDDAWAPSTSAARTERPPGA